MQCQFPNKKEFEKHIEKKTTLTYHVFTKNVSLLSSYLFYFVIESGVTDCEILRDVDGKQN